MTIGALAIHGGAGASRKLGYALVRDHLHHVVELGRAALTEGRPALDVAILVVADMEASGLYVAGRGGSPNTIGEYELDACVMDGPGRRAGSVACVRGVVSPVQLARLVMEETPHVMLCGSGAEAFARSMNVEMINDPAWFTHAGQGESNFAPGHTSGTVGCAVRDANGLLASATSTAGVFDKTPGRVGDSPLIGAGAWADENVAVSCTGQGEIFIRAAAASRLAFLVGEGHSLETAAARVMTDIAALGGEGGFAAIDAGGRVVTPYNAEGMKRAHLSMGGEIRVSIFDD